jgi:hypothetical protein
MATSMVMKMPREHLQRHKDFRKVGANILVMDMTKTQGCPVTQKREKEQHVHVRSKGSADLSGRLSMGEMGV